MRTGGLFEFDLSGSLEVKTKREINYLKRIKGNTKVLGTSENRVDSDSLQF